MERGFTGKEEGAELRKVDADLILEKIGTIRTKNRMLSLMLDKAEGIEIIRLKDRYLVYVYFSTWQLEIELDVNLQIISYRTSTVHFSVSTYVEDTVYTVVSEK